MRIVHRVHNGKLVAVGEEPPRKKTYAERRKEKAKAIAAKRKAREAAYAEEQRTVTDDRTPAESQNRAQLHYDFTVLSYRHMRDL